MSVIGFKSIRFYLYLKIQYGTYLKNQSMAAQWRTNFNAPLSGEVL